MKKLVAQTLQSRFAEAYRTMAEKANYRPAAPGDGIGGIYLSRGELADRAILEDEAQLYAECFLAEDESRNFCLGCSNYRTNRELVYVVEAARLLNGGLRGDPVAVKLLRLALAGLTGQEER